MIGKLINDNPATIGAHSMKKTIDEPLKTGKFQLVSERKTNKEYRNREHLTSKEIDKLMHAAKSTGRHRVRDASLILFMYRHALRVGEVVNLKWSDVDLDLGRLHVTRLKKGITSTHPLRAVELRALKNLQREYASAAYVFVNERGSPLSTDSVHNVVSRAGVTAALPFTVHPHMLRHSLGYYLANNGEDTRSIQEYMGHASINNTVRYTALSAKRFDKFFCD